MSINKMALSLAVAGILGASSALAEQSGAFIGVQAGFGTSNYKIDANPSAEADFKGLRYGIMFGQKGFSSDYPYFGIRYYILGDYGVYKFTDIETFEINTFNLSVNLDALFNFLSFGDDFELGVFAGVGLGYAYHKVPISEMIVSGFDAGVNLGVRGNIAQNHSVEFYTHFGFIEQEVKTYAGFISVTEKVSQPYQAGFRYVYAF